MRLLLISDTHSRDLAGLSLPDALPEAYQPTDVLLHAGDIEDSEEEYAAVCEEAGISFYAVSGNNDFASDLPSEQILYFENTRLLLTHGHEYRVSLYLDELASEARARDCDIAVFGHTHRPFLDMVGGVLLLNPGSLSYPRSTDRRPTCIVLELTGTRFTAVLLYTDTMEVCGRASGDFADKYR